MSDSTWVIRNSFALLEAWSHAFCETARAVTEGVDVELAGVESGDSVVGRGAAPDVMSQSLRCLSWRVTMNFHRKKLLASRRLSILVSSSLKTSNIMEGSDC